MFSSKPTPVVIFERITRDNIADKIPEVARALDISEQTVRELSSHGELNQHFFDAAACNAGNDALKLENVKRNVAANLQNLALFVFHNYKQFCTENKEAFNQLFKLIARITDENKLEFSDDSQNHCAQRSLEDLEKLLSSVYFSELMKRITPSIIAHLLALNSSCQANTVMINGNNVKFTNTIQDYSKKASMERQEAAKLAAELERLKAAKTATKDHPENRNVAVKRKLPDPMGVPAKDNSAAEENASNPPAKKPRFWQSETFRRTVTGLVLFGAICLLGAGIAFSGGALGIGLLFAGIALAAAGVIMTAFTNKKFAVPLPFHVGASYKVVFQQIPFTRDANLNPSQQQAKIESKEKQDDLMEQGVDHTLTSSSANSNNYSLR